MAVLKISKMDRDYGMFGLYEVKLGARVYADATVMDPVNLGEFDTTYELDEPDYDSGDFETDPSELNYMTIDHKQWDINVQ